MRDIEMNLDMSVKDNFMIAPIIISTNINGGFSRKLRMLRADLFSMLAVTQSSKFMKTRKQSTRIN